MRISPLAAGASFPADRTIVPPAWLAGIVLLALIVAVSPYGYVGGGNDDWYYLEAARCGAAHGLCLPATHWAARFPVVAPMAGAVAAFGVGAVSAGIVTLLYAGAAVVLLTANVERRFGRGPAAIAGAVLALTPAFSRNAVQPQVDIAELAWVLAALLAAQIAVERHDRRAAALAGIALALAIMTRMSALAFLPIAGIGWLMLPRDRRRLAWPFGLALAATLGAEAAGYWIATGNPAYGWLLSLHHTAIPSTELPPGIDLSRSALFNMDFIRGWRRSMDIHVHWTVDPLLNLLADPLGGLTLIGAAVLVLIRRRDWRATPWVGAIAGAAALHFLILTYVLAIDPKPRMFLFEFAAAAAIIGVFAGVAWRHGNRAIVVALAVLLTGRAMLVVLDRVDPRPSQAVAESWLASAPGAIAVDDWTRRTLALSPTIYAARVAGPDFSGPVLALATDGCAQAAITRGPQWRVARERQFTHADPVPVAWLRQRAILFGPRAEPSLCLLSPTPDRGASPPR